MKLQLTNAGQTPIVVKDQEGYTDFALSVDPGTSATADVSPDLVSRLAPYLKAMETPVYDSDGTTIITALRWAVLASDDVDDRALPEGLAGLPTLTEFQAASYSTGGGATGAVAAGTGLLGNQTKASLSISEGAAQLDLEAVVPGAPSNAVTVAIAIGSSLSVGVVGNAITVTLPAIGDAVSDIVTALNGDADASLLVQASEGAAGNITAAVDATALAGGTGPGVSLSLNGTACSITELTDTAVTFNIATGISADGRIVPLDFRNGPHLSRLSIPVVA
jgi:hypothetical protein